ncbi:MAG: sensor histidine kinase [Patescibacteria group bacterium]
MFDSARLKLTAWYLVIILLVSISFSMVIYRVSTFELERFDRVQRFRIERRITEGGVRIFAPPFIDPQLVAETKKRIILTLMSINGGIFILSGIAGYFLAGRTLKPIKKIVEEQNRFVSDASHELRTPLTALKSAFEVHLRDKKLTLKEAKTLIADSIQDVNKLQALSDSLLQLTHFQDPSRKNSLNQVSLSELTAEALRKVSSLSKQKQILLVNKTQEMIFEGNKDSLTDLLVILLDNAIKYSPEGKKVEIRSKKVNRNLQISMKDEGMGISAKDLPLIFDRFYRANSARTKQDTGGYGLGLAIAKKIVDTHKGTISVESKLGKGSIFTVFLPLKQSFS